MELSAKNLKLISRAVRYFLAELHVKQMDAIKEAAVSSADNGNDGEVAAALVQDIADYTQLHRELDTYLQYSKYPLSD